MADDKEGRGLGAKRRRHKPRTSRSAVFLVVGMLGSAVTMFVLYWILFPSTSSHHLRQR